MKTITCEQMGGPCDHKMTANSPEEMMKKRAEHVEMNHPEITERMKNTSYEENKDWEHSFMKTWRMTPNM